MKNATFYNIISFVHSLGIQNYKILLKLGAISRAKKDSSSSSIFDGNSSVFSNVKTGIQHSCWLLKCVWNSSVALKSDIALFHKLQQNEI